MTRKEWKAAALVAVVGVGLTVFFNLIQANGRLASLVVILVAALGSGWVANVDIENSSRQH